MDCRPGHGDVHHMSTVFDPLCTTTAALDVVSCACVTSAVIALRQQTRLARLLDAAARGSPLYRERLHGQTPATTPLSAVPRVSKCELMARFDEWVTDPQLKLAELRAFTADPHRIGEAYLDKYLIWESSGTSHQAGIFVQDAQSMAVYDALELIRRSAPRPLHSWFAPWLMAERIAFVGATSGHFASIVSMQRLQKLNPLMAQSLRCFSILQSTSALVDELNAFAPTVIATYPTVAALLADQASQGLLHFVPKEIWTGGETLTAAVRQRVGQALGCAVRNSYGASEFMSIGWECCHGKMHANTDWVILEPVDEQGRPTPAGQPSASILLTNLANHVQPLIRYDLGDQMTLGHERCECGSPLPVIEVRGRRDDSLVMSGRDGRPVTLLPLALTTVLEDEAGVFDFQLSQRDDRTLVLRLDLQGAEAAMAAARCRTAIENFAAVQGLAPIRIIAELGKPVPKGRSGKRQRIVVRPAAKRS